MKPTKKVAAGGAAGSFTILVVYAAGQCGFDVPPEVASAFTVLVSSVAAWLRRS